MEEFIEISLADNRPELQLMATGVVEKPQIIGTEVLCAIQRANCVPDEIELLILDDNTK